MITMNSKKRQDSRQVRISTLSLLVSWAQKTYCQSGFGLLYQNTVDRVGFVQLAFMPHKSRSEDSKIRRAATWLVGVSFSLENPLFIIKFMKGQPYELTTFQSPTS